MKLKKPSTQATHTHPMLSFFSALFSALFFFTSAHADNRGSTRCDLVRSHYEQISKQLTDTCKSAGLSSYIPSCIRQAGDCESAIEGAGGLAAVVRNPSRMGRSCPAIANISVSALKEQKKELKEDLERLADQMEKYRREAREAKKDSREAKKDARDRINDANKEIASTMGEITEAQTNTAKEIAEAEEAYGERATEQQKNLNDALTKLAEAEQIEDKGRKDAEKSCDTMVESFWRKKLESVEKRKYYGSFNDRGKSYNDVATFRSKIYRHCRALPEYGAALLDAANAQKSAVISAQRFIGAAKEAIQAEAAKHAQSQEARRMAGAQTIQGIQQRISALQKDKANAAEDLADAEEEIADAQEESEQELRRISQAYSNKEKKLKKIEQALDAVRGQSLPSSGGDGDKNAGNILSIVEAGDEYYAVKNKVEAGDCGSGHAISRATAERRRKLASEKRRKKRERDAVADDVLVESADGVE